MTIRFHKRHLLRTIVILTVDGRDHLMHVLYSWKERRSSEEKRVIEQRFRGDYCLDFT